MKNWIKLTLCITAPLITGAIAGIVTSANIESWYSELNKPSFNPPNYLFGPVWTTLYIIMGISFYMLLQSPTGVKKRNALVVFGLQWGLNFLWSFIFFQFHSLAGASIEICLLLVSILVLIYLLMKIDRRIAILQLPYLLWVSFATLLTFSIWMIN